MQELQTISAHELNKMWSMTSDHGRKLVLSQQDKPQIYRSVHQVAQADVIRIIFFMAILVSSV